MGKSKNTAGENAGEDLFSLLSQATGTSDFGLDKAVGDTEASELSDVVRQRRTEILEAALKVFAKKGFDGSRTKEIAGEAGVSEATVFKYFPTKKNLLVSIMRPVIESIIKPYFRNSITRIIDQAAELGLEECLVRILKDRYELVQKNNRLIRTMALELSRQEDLLAVFRQLALPLVTTELDRLFEGARERGEIGSDINPVAFRRNLMAIFAGNIALMRLAPEHFMSRDIDTEIGDSIRMFIRGIQGGTE